jgi:hypothetical protein
MLLTFLIFTKFTFAGHIFVKNSCSEFHDNPINSLVANTRQQAGYSVANTRQQAGYTVLLILRNRQDIQCLHISC